MVLLGWGYKLALICTSPVPFVLEWHQWNWRWSVLRLCPPKGTEMACPEKRGNTSKNNWIYDFAGLGIWCLYLLQGG